jgi:hypothetical protein
VQAGRRSPRQWHHVTVWAMDVIGDIVPRERELLGVLPAVGLLVA